MLRTILLTTLLGFSLAAGVPAIAQTAVKDAAHASVKHKVVLQVSDNDPKKWTLALNNANNIQKDIGRDNVEIEVVAYGPGIGMLKLDSPVAQRIQDALTADIKVVACQNTMRGQHLTKEDMLAEIGYVPSGVVELMKKEEAGYAYLRP